MRILMTGGAGFIGSHLCDRLLSRGHSILCVDNFVTGREANVAHLRSNPSFELIRHDVSRPLKIKGKLDFVLHLASPASPPDYLKYPIPTLQAGSLGSWNMLEIARENRARFLLASTSEVYGDPQVHPQPEEYWGHVNPIGPRSVYDEAKRFAEALTMAYYREYRLDTRIVRLFNTHGPRMRKDDGRAVPNFITQAVSSRPITLYGTGSQTRSFCYVSDMTAGIEAVMKCDFHDPINLGNPAEISLLELAKAILSLTQSKSKIVYKPLPVDDPKHRCPDIRRARTLLKWEPMVSLEEGLSKTISWFSEQVFIR